jgi:hypothetical protein
MTAIWLQLMAFQNWTDTMTGYLDVVSFEQHPGKISRCTIVKLNLTEN